MRHQRVLAAVGAAVLLVGTFLVGYRAGAVRGAAPPAARPDPTAAQFVLLRDLQRLVETRYIDRRTTSQQLLYGAARGMLEALGDPYTRFMEPRAYREFQDASAGVFSGIGIMIELKDGEVVVVSPMPGTPAARAGLAAGDRIVEIDGRPTREMALQRAVSLIRGAPGTAVRLRIVRAGRPLAVTVTRQVVHAPSVEGEEVLDPAARARLHRLRVGYLRILMFDQTTADEFRRALREVAARAPRGLVLDLRDNGGGLVDAAIGVADEFVPSGPIVSTVDRNGVRTSAYATGAARYRRPIAVLVNEYTASASEILAGALQDDRLATLVGVRTFGKGIVQTVFSLPGGAGAAITTDQYLTPAGRSIHRTGLAPDVAVGARLEGKPPAEVRRIRDAQLGRALDVLERRLAGPARPRTGVSMCLDATRVRGVGGSQTGATRGGGGCGWQPRRS